MMNPNNAAFRMSLLATAIALSLINVGCGGAADTTTSIAEAAVTGTDATTLSIDEAGKRRRTASSETKTTVTSTTAATTQRSTSTTTATSTTTNQTTTNTPTLTTATIQVATATTTPQTDLSNLPLLYKDNLVHIGAFRATVGDLDKPNTLSAGGNVLAYNSKNNSLIIDGHIGYQYLSEITVPNSIAFNPLDISSLNKNSTLQAITNSLEYKLSQINPTDTNSQYAGGVLAYNGKLIIGAYSYYDAQGKQSGSHFTRALDLSLTNSMSNAITLPGVKPRWVGGAMAEIPIEWQSALGGPVLSGIGGLAIGSASSNGPSAAVIDPENLTSKPAVQLVGYPLELPLSRLHGYGNDVQNPIWNRLTQTRGILFPKGSRSILFYGRHGLGPLCYGSGLVCNDPSDPYKGYHAYPYSYQVWAYDALDFQKVRNGLMPPENVKPYAVWTFDLPFQENAPMREIGQVAYDSSTGRIFVSQIRGYSVGYTAEPIIHVFNIK